jgi:hypothetical protein
VSGHKGYRAFKPTLAIENVVQSAARNGTCAGKLLLEDRYPYIMSVHDEVMLIVPNTPDEVLGARNALIDVFGPGRLPGWDWSVVLDPSDINVSSSLYEVGVGNLLPPTPDGKPRPSSEWWEQLAAGNHSLLENLP